jgi:hypothetical protein
MMMQLKMSQCYYDNVDKYLDRSDFQYAEMDTDSAYMALADDFEKLVKPEMREEFERERSKWFLRNDTKENYNYDKRVPGYSNLSLLVKVSSHSRQKHTMRKVLGIRLNSVVKEYKKGTLVNLPMRSISLYYLRMQQVL